MMRGTSNEGFTLNAIRNHAWVNSVYKVGMRYRKAYECYSDAVTLMDYPKFDEDVGWRGGGNTHV